MAQRKKTLRRKTSAARGKARKAAKPPRRKAGKRAAAKPTPRKRRSKAPRKPTTARKVTRKTAKPTRTPRPPAAQGVPAPAAQSRTPLDLDQALSKPIEADLIPGVVALVADDRGIFYKAAFGMRSVDKPEPMTADSVFRIASMTKAVTGAAAMQLVEQGRIGLDQPMGDVVPVIRDVKVLDGFDADGAPQLRDPRAPVTLRHLLTHTSGYGYDIFHTDLGRYIQIAGLPSIVTCKNDALQVGGSPQHLLLDRHQPADYRRRHDANSAGRRPARARDHGELRAGALCRTITRLARVHYRRLPRARNWRTSRRPDQASPQGI
jgi:hypothetical protein